MREFTALAQMLEAQGISFVRREPLSRHTTFKVGGPAELFVSPGTSEQICTVLELSRQAGLPCFLLGKGSNLLVDDGPIEAVILHLGDDFAAMREENGVVWCESGAPLSKLCLFAQQCGLQGLVFAYGIPGTVGGGVYMNAGAYGGELGDVIRRVLYLDEQGRQCWLAGEALGFGYRRSAFIERKGCILGAELVLSPDDPIQIRREMEEILGRRREKQPLELGSAGSTFKRPAGAYASALIDQCGLKGLTVGGAQVSTKHAGFVVNTGHATCAEIRELIEQVREIVKSRTGFLLEPEVKFLSVTGQLEAL